MVCEMNPNKFIYPETLTEWKSESITYLPTYGLTGVGARDACATKNHFLELILLPLRRM